MSVRLKMVKEQRIGFVILVSFIIIIELIIHSDWLFSGEVIVEKLPLEIVKEIEKSSRDVKRQDFNLSVFNPNDYSKEDWVKIGFSSKQAQAILKYKNLVGGQFISKEQLKKCFVISEEKYKVLSSYILLPERLEGKSEVVLKSKQQKSYILQNFDPNIYSADDWVNIGFSPKQAEIILKYKKIVGGKFSSKEQLKKCFVISDEKYSEILPYIRFSESLQKNKNPLKEKLIEGEKRLKGLNSAGFEDFMGIVENAALCKRIINFRKSLGGFVSKEQIREVYGLSSEMAILILNNFDLDISGVIKINLKEISEKELQSHVYLRKYKQKIIELQRENKDPKEAISKNDPKYHLIIKYLY